jgi:hypothetical protein
LQFWASWKKQKQAFHCEQEYEKFSTPLALEEFTFYFFSISSTLYTYVCARVVELADTPDLGSGALSREGSSPFPGTIGLPAINVFG